MVAVKGLSMEKWLCWGSIGVAGLLLLLFLLDLFTGFPFYGISPAVDIMGAVCCAAARRAAAGPARRHAPA